MAGFQLWVNLPASRKLTAPRYQDLPPEQIPVVNTAGGAVVKVVAGAYGGVLGPVGGVDTEPTMLDVALPPGGREVIALPQGHTAFFYVFEGGVQVHGLDRDVDPHTLVVLSDGDAVELFAGARGGRALLLAGRPLREPIVQYGPFVMNTRAEIERAIEDYQAGRFGG
jgi:redox-sensitive bicupin YhaK (pirin superfamily)